MNETYTQKTEFIDNTDIPQKEKEIPITRENFLELVLYKIQSQNPENYEKIKNEFIRIAIGLIDQYNPHIADISDETVNHSMNFVADILSWHLFNTKKQIDESVSELQTTDLNELVKNTLLKLDHVINDINKRYAKVLLQWRICQDGFLTYINDQFPGNIENKLSLPLIYSKIAPLDFVKAYLKGTVEFLEQMLSFVKSFDSALIKNLKIRDPFFSEISHKQPIVIHLLKLFLINTFYRRGVLMPITFNELSDFLSISMTVKEEQNSYRVSISTQLLEQTWRNLEEYCKNHALKPECSQSVKLLFDSVFSPNSTILTENIDRKTNQLIIFSDNPFVKLYDIENSIDMESEVNLNELRNKARNINNILLKIEVLATQSRKHSALDNLKKILDEDNIQTFVRFLCHLEQKKFNSLIKYLLRLSSEGVEEFTLFSSTDPATQIKEISELNDLIEKGEIDEKRLYAYFRAVRMGIDVETLILQDIKLLESDPIQFAASEDLSLSRIDKFTSIYRDVLTNKAYLKFLEGYAEFVLKKRIM